jgi:hypothetical protein
MNNIDKDIVKRNIIRCEKALNENKMKYTFDLDYKKMWEDLVDKSLDLQEEYRELKLQNLELRNIYFNVTHINKIYTKELNRYIAKQQKFINFLENMLDDENDIFSVVRVKDVLQKYKEMIGGKDENK